MAKAKFSFSAFEDTLRGTGLRSAQQQRYPSGGDVIQYDEATLTATSNPSNYSMRARYRRDNDTFQMWFRITLTGSPGGSGAWNIDVPYPMDSLVMQDGVIGTWRARRSSVATMAAGPIMYTSASKALFEYPAAWPSGTPTNVSSTAPWAWAANDTIGGYISAIIDRSV